MMSRDHRPSKTLKSIALYRPFSRSQMRELDMKTRARGHAGITKVKRAHTLLLSDLVRYYSRKSVFPRLPLYLSKLKKVFKNRRNLITSFLVKFFSISRLLSFSSIGIPVPSLHMTSSLTSKRRRFLQPRPSSMSSG